MADARFTFACDVYVFLDAHDGYVCQQCKLQPDGRRFATATAAEMIAHLIDEHRARGHRVPDDALDGLRADDELVG